MTDQEALAADIAQAVRHEIGGAFKRIEACVERLSDDQIWARGGEHENAVGNLILHLAGNVRQWIICGLGGSDDRRERPAEFARRQALPRDELLGTLRTTLDEAFTVLDALDPVQLLPKRKIQAYEVSGLHAVMHVATHFGEHTGQIIWATKRVTGEDLGFYDYLDKKAD